MQKNKEKKTYQTPLDHPNVAEPLVPKQFPGQASFVSTVDGSMSCALVLRTPYTI